MEIGPMNLPSDTLRLWPMHREFRAEPGLARGDVARIACDEAERRIGTPDTSRANAPAAGWQRPSPMPGG
jgi:hypothetical protein